MAKKGDKTGDERDAKGRFQRGNRGGPGNPNLLAMGRFRQALDAASSPEDAADVLMGFLAIARGEPRPTDENPNPPAPSYTDRIAAGRAYLERAAGKPTEPPVVIPEGLFDFELTDARSALDAMRQITEAAGRGDIDLGTAKALGELLDVRDRLELAVMAERLDRIEAKEHGAA